MLEPLIKKEQMKLIVSYRSNEGTYSDKLHQKDICTTSQWVNSVVEVIVSEYKEKTEPITLKSYRAKRLIKLINEYNRVGDEI